MTRRVHRENFDWVEQVKLDYIAATFKLRCMVSAWKAMDDSRERDAQFDDAVEQAICKMALSMLMIDSGL